MFELDKITLNEYIALPNKIAYDTLLECSGKSNTFNKKTINILELSYTNVKYCLSLLHKIKSFDDLFLVYEVLFDCDRKSFFNSDIVSFYKSRNYILETFKNIQENESKLASSTKTDARKWQMAGGKRLEPFNDTLPLDQLAQRYGGSPLDWGRKPYSEVFYLVAMTITSNDVNNNYNTMK
jgi:hypothetical protein